LVDCQAVAVALFFFGFGFWVLLLLLLWVFFCMGGIESESGGERGWASIAARRGRPRVEEEASSCNQQQQLRLLASMCRIWSCSFPAAQ